MLPLEARPDSPGALARDGVSREVPCSALKGETVPDSLPASVGCYGSLASGFVEIKESPFSMSESQIQAVSGKLGSTLAKIS